MKPDAEVERIARGLTEAQREAVLLWEATTDELEQAQERLVKLQEGLGREGPRVLWSMGLATKPRIHLGRRSVLTQLGLAVRQRLLSEAPHG